MLGLLLAKRGAEVIVLEGHEDFEREFRGEVLQPSTAHLLDELGLLEYVQAQPHSLLEVGQIRLNGREVGEFAFKRIAPEYPYAIWMPQPIFLDALRRKAEAFPTFQCWMGAKVTKLIEENGRVVGVSGLRHGKEPFEVRADVVVGADGRYSTIAKLGGFEAEYEHHDFDIIWFTIEQPPGWSSTFYVSLGEAARPDAAEVSAPHPGRDPPAHRRVEATGARRAWRRWPSASGASIRSSPASPTALHDFTPFFPLEGLIRLVRDWARDGLLLIGDAAHTMSPAGAIGVNVALATAAVAAQEIYPRLGHGPIARERPAGSSGSARPTCARCIGCSSAPSACCWVRAAATPRAVAACPALLPLFLRSPLLPRLQRRIFFGAPLPPLDPAFSFREPAAFGARG